MTREQMREWVTRTRAEQGLPPRVEDPAALNRIAELLRLHDDDKQRKRAS